MIKDDRRRAHRDTSRAAPGRSPVCQCRSGFFSSSARSIEAILTST
jgi:hypothetical protein